jgi:type IV pilus assembly protein PilY1
MNLQINKCLLALNILLFSSFSYSANPVNPPNIPLESGSATSTKPNLMFIFDDSGSMKWDYLGDEVSNNLCKGYSGLLGLTLNYFYRPCFSDTNSNASRTLSENFLTFDSRGNQTTTGDSLFFSYELNKMYFNPNIKYVEGVKADGTSLGAKSFNSATINTYVGTTRNIDLNNLQETYFCNSTLLLRASDLNDSNKCRRNGVNNGPTYNYYTQGYPNSTFKYDVLGPWTPHYNTIVATEYCDNNLVNCSSSSNYGKPAPIRWCKTEDDAISTNVISGLNNKKQNRCQKNYQEGYTYLRIGNIKRVTLTTAQYSNFANWFSYYRTRHDAMRTSVGLAFKGIDNTKRVGFITINPGSNTESKFLPIKDFDQNQKNAFYNLLYSVAISGGTPLREALSRVGRYYAGKTDGLNRNMISKTNPDPVQFSCQQNYAILSTDGYWNGNGGKDLSSNNITNQDNIDSGYSSRASGSYDGNLSGSKETLSDVAMYYYKNDLRPAGSKNAEGVDVSENNVPISPLDSNPQQHMVTYAISLGLNGFVEYSRDYLQGKNQDFENIKLGTSGACSWTTGNCNWPEPTNDDPSAIDDVWHSTVNGRGKYYSAQNTQDIIDGLTDALNSLIAQTAASSSASTSSPNITATENTLFYSTYRTVHWDGEIAARTIDYITGEISTNAKWKAGVLLNQRTNTSTDNRTIYTSRISSTGSALINFDYSTFNTKEKEYFSNKCNNLSQCSSLTNEQKNLVNNGETLINYLRGRTTYEADTNSTNPLYRERENLLGDLVDTSPVYVSNSPYNWSDSGYAEFKASVDNRQPILYASANDGMLHAFNATNGREEWAFVPRQILPNLSSLADKNYALNHKFYVNGPITVMDAKIGTTWKTVLVGALGQGGKGYYALDITNPTSPSVLWELCTDDSLCYTTDDDLGYTYGNPLITKRATDNRWVAYVSAGYDNNSGVGTIFEVDLRTGSILRRLKTNSGSSSSPSGLAFINSYYDNFTNDNKARVLYAGDLNGDVWRWELRSGASTVANHLGYASSTKNSTKVRQPISTKIELGNIEDNPILFFGTGKYLNFDDYNTIDIQSAYALKDPYGFCLREPYVSDSNKWNDSCKKELGYGDLKANNKITKQNSNTPTNAVKTVANGSNVVDWSSNIGWYFDFQSQAGERVNIDPILVLGTLNITTNVPASNTCNMGGNAWIYQFNYLNGNAISGQNGTIGFKHTGGFVVGQTIARLEGSGIIKNFITDAGGNVQSVGVNINSNSLKSNKSSWNEIIK